MTITSVQNCMYLEWWVHNWLNRVLEIPDAKLPLLSPRSEPIRRELTELQSTNLADRTQTQSAHDANPVRTPGT
jgi:hypothetical protein